MSIEELLDALLCNNMGDARELLDRGVDVNTEYVYNYNTPWNDPIVRTPLCVAISKDDLIAVKLLLTSGADPNYQGYKDGYYGEHPLSLAAKAGNLDCLETLIQHDADVLQKDKKDNSIALHTAAYHNRRAAFYLIDNFTIEIALRQLYWRNSDGKKLLDLYEQCNLHYEQCDFKKQAKLTMEDVQQRTVKLEKIFLLAESGILQYNNAKIRYLNDEMRMSRLNQRNQIGDTPLHCASRTGQLAVAKFLVEQNADRLVPNDRGCIALHLAARWNRTDVVRCLTSNTEPEMVAKQVSARDVDGRTPAELCAHFGHTKLADYLNQLVADKKPLFPSRYTALSSANGNSRSPTTITAMPTWRQLVAESPNVAGTERKPLVASTTLSTSKRSVLEENSCLQDVKRQVNSLRQDVGDLGSVVGARLDRLEKSRKKRSTCDVLRSQ